MEQENQLPKGYKLKEFQIESVLGAGGFGVTYLATDTNLNTKVVIKEFLPREFSARQGGDKSIVPYTSVKQDGTYEYLLKKFVKEAQILASIKHPNIVQVFSFFRANNTAYFVMDYIKGESLKSYLSRKGVLDEERVLSIIMPVLEGLKKVHEKNYLHRDIAPDNIYLRQNGMPMLIDFGAAKNATGEKSTSLAAIVKAGYSAPEQYVTSSNHSPATDIYAIGSVLYSMISGKVAPESTQRQMAILNGQEDPLEDIVSNYRGKYSKELLETIQKAMRIPERERFQNVADMQKSIADGIPDITPTPIPNNSWIKNVIIGLLLLVLAFGGYTIITNQHNKNKDREQVEEKIQQAKREAEQKAQEEITRAKREAQAKVDQANAKVEKIDKEKRQELLRKIEWLEGQIVEGERIIDSIKYSDVGSPIAEELKEAKQYMESAKNSIHYGSLNETEQLVEQSEAHLNRAGKLVDTLAKLIEEEEKKKRIDFGKRESLDLNNDNISLTFSYPLNVKRGEDIYIEASLQNNGKEEPHGGVNLSFPQFYSLGVTLIYNDFRDLKPYNTLDKVWSKTESKAISPEYFIVESNDKWTNGERHRFRIAINTPKDITQFKIQVRGALKNRVVPSYGIEDQQGYYCKVIVINIID